MKENLSEALAVRLAEICLGMGLDDTDEDLLWKYVASLGKGARLARPIAAVLDQKAEFDPVIVEGYNWRATMPERFYTPERMVKSRWGFGLRARGTMESGSTGLYTRSAEAYTTDLTQRLGRACFENWRDEITACLRPDGRNWEPPTDQDIQLQLHVKVASLSEKLRQLM
ncbi:hypothetical protein [Pseudomonas sp. PLMAX]|uniref:hypothetical protein n=1 Tax=Pseudomonas sp. PLMAX TaxID=2201998 RepID=UPI0038BDEFDE